MKPFNDIHDEHYAAVGRALEAAGVEGDHQTRDANMALHRQHWLAMGIDPDDLNVYVESLYGSWKQEVDDLLRETGNPMVAVATAFRGAVSTAILVVASGVTGIETPEDIGPIYEERDGIVAGGYICDHGMVTALGVDASGRVAVMRDGELEPGNYRVEPEVFLEHFRRIDDVPVLGGDDA